MAFEDSSSTCAGLTLIVVISLSALWENTEKLSSFLDKVDQFDAIFYVGGHGREFLSFPLQK